VARLRPLLATFLLIALTPSAMPGAVATADGSLRRAPYLTDLVRRGVTVNWATTTAVTTGSVRYGTPAEGCDADEAIGSRSSITVGSTTLYQWRARLRRLTLDTTYCYRVYGGGLDLLGSDPTPSFRSRVPAGTTTPFSFAVFGDWGEVAAGSLNADQARVLHQVAISGARFAVTTGDTGYPNGTQTTYGDLVQTGDDVSAIFGPAFWTAAGSSIALFNAQGNHGMNAVGLVNWPQDAAVSASTGRYAMQRYCCPNGTEPADYPSAWYAFNAGPARFYVLEAAWDANNLGTGDLYANDHAAHWTATSEEYRWLEHELETHHRRVAFAFFHFPLYSDNPSETSDPWLHGPGDLEELLGDHGVDIVFNGHAHIYQRNQPSASGMPVTYVTGGGGAHLEPVSACDAIDRYAVGWSPKFGRGSACGAAPTPTSTDQVFHFLLVTVDGTTVTVRPTDELGRSFDVQTYDLSSSG
jgi:hypothetical protein